MVNHLVFPALHKEISIGEIFSPVKAGDGLTCAATIESYRVAAGNEIVTVRSDLHREGALVISAWSTLVVRA